jgi:hypothetical protein
LLCSIVDIMTSGSITCIALGLLPTLCACGEYKSCTQSGTCNDQFRVEISEAGISMPNLAADLVIDGRRASCSAPSLTTGAQCDSGVTVLLAEQGTCRGEWSGCVGGLDTYIEEIIITGAPKTVNISLHTGAGIIVAQQTFQPQYTSSEPNGPGCAPICNQATVSWSLP